MAAVLLLSYEIVRAFALCSLVFQGRKRVAFFRLPKQDSASTRAVKILDYNLNLKVCQIDLLSILFASCLILF